VNSMTCHHAADRHQHLAAGRHLVKADRASMAHGLELRSPFLDREVMAVATGWRGRRRRRHDDQVRAAEAVAPLLPQEASERRKLGFPCRSALVPGELSGYATGGARGADRGVAGQTGGIDVLRRFRAGDPTRRGGSLGAGGVLAVAQITWSGSSTRWPRLAGPNSRRVGRAPRGPFLRLGRGPPAAKGPPVLGLRREERTTTDEGKQG